MLSFLLDSGASSQPKIPGEPFNVAATQLSEAGGGELVHLINVLGTAPPASGPNDQWRRRQIGLHRVGAAFLACADALVTTDHDDLLRKSETIRVACGIDVIDPQAAVDRITS